MSEWYGFLVLVDLEYLVVSRGSHCTTGYDLVLKWGNNHVETREGRKGEQMVCDTSF